MRLVLSREGQEIIASEADGYVPLNAEEARSEILRLTQALVGPPPRRQAARQGIVTIVGDARLAVLDAWCDKYRRQHPGADFRMTLRSAAVGMDGIVAGVSPFAALARDAWPGELEGFERLRGFTPRDIRAGRAGYLGAVTSVPTRYRLSCTSTCPRRLPHRLMTWYWNLRASRFRREARRFYASRPARDCYRSRHRRQSWSLGSCADAATYACDSTVPLR